MYFKHYFGPDKTGIFDWFFSAFSAKRNQAIPLILKMGAIISITVAQFVIGFMPLKMEMTIETRKSKGKNKILRV
jgi:hypothetical protein